MPQTDVDELKRPLLTPEGWWAVRLWVVVLAFVGVAVARSIQLGIPFRDPHGEFLVHRVIYTAIAFTVLVALDGVIRAGNKRSLSDIWATIRDRWDRRRLAAAVLALAAYDVTYVTYHNLKSWAVFNTPQDAMLDRWDRWLFGGHSPAVLLHDLLGTGVAPFVLDWYQTFGFLAIVAFPALVAWTPHVRDAFVGIAALVWTWILGTASYYLIPSLGPFHFRPQDFASLPAMSVQDSQARLISQRDYLLAHSGAHDAFAQVSAFASLHVGITAAILGLAWWHRLRRTTAVLAVFLVGTLIATVYLGYHFVVDLPAGLLIAGVAWVLGPLTVGVRHRPQ